MPVERILLIDAEVDQRARVRLELERQGHEVRCVEDAPTALHYLHDQHTRTDLVLCTGRLSGPAAIELVREVKERTPEIEVIIAAHPADHADLVPCLAAGALALITWPCHPIELSAAVARGLERRALRTSRAHDHALRAVFASVDPERLAEAVVTAWVRVLNADQATLFLPLQRENGRLGAAYSWGPQPAPAEDGQSLLDWMSVAPQPVFVAERCARWLGERPTGIEKGPGVIMPLLSGRRLIGVLTADRFDRPLEAADVDAASVLLSCARTALDNTQILKHLAHQERLSVLGQLAAGLAHEVKNPLTYVLENARYLSEGIIELTSARDRNGVSGAAEVLAAESFYSVERLRQAAAETVDGASRIREIIRDIDALASADETTRVPFDLNDSIRAAVRMTTREMHGRAQVLTRLGRSVQIIGSPGRMTQVFVNLLVNAAQAVGQSRTDGSISVISRRENGRVQVEISDNGPGIPKENLARIFEAFFTTKAPGEGTGLGLFLCQDILRRHGGSIRARSSPTHGTTLLLDLPANPMLAEVEEPSHERHPAPLLALV